MKLQDIPEDPLAPSYSNDSTITQLFGKVEKTVDKKAVASHFKQPLLVAMLCGVVLLPATDKLIVKIYPKASENVYLLIVLKMIIVAVLYYLISNWGLIRN